MSELLGQIGDLSPEEHELFQLLLEEKGIDTRGTQTIPLRTETSPCQLSFAQARLWFLSQLDPDSPLYNMPAAVRLIGALNVAALKQIFNEIVRRHEVLRTTFVIVNGQPVQVIAPTLILPLPVVNLQELPELEREAEVLRLATSVAQRPFDLTQGPLLRTTLLQLGAAEYVLLFTMHHIISDGWSIEVLIQEVVVLYEVFCSGKPSPLADLPIQYADFAIWQRQWLQGEVMANQLAYWQQQLSHHPPVLQLPTDRPRPVVQSFRGSTKSFSLSTKLTDALKVLSQGEEATLFMTLLAAFQTLLYRYTGQEDILVGSPIANRDRFETDALIGFFVNTLVLRTDLSGNPSFRELLARVREMALSAYEHQEMPFEQLVAELQPERDLSRNPLIQVMFTLQNAPVPVMEFAGLTLSPVEFDSGMTKFDLILTLSETPEGLTGRLEYNTDLFDAATIAKMVRYFQTLLTGIVSDPDQSILNLPLLTTAERHQLLVEWNDNQIDYPQDKCIHQLFEAQVERTPDAVAVVFEEQQLTYQQLNQRANQLAHYLRTLGVKPEVLVGLCLERSLEMVVGLLGILKAGGTYVPLDPADPQERLAFMLEDARVAVLIQQQKVEGLPEHKARVVFLDADWQVIAQHSEENFVGGVTIDNLAYVIYTSGSTGRSKGVMNTHHGLCNRLLWMQDAYRLTTADGVLHKTPFSFDVSIWELLWPLLSGAQLVVARPEGHKDSAYLVKLITEQQITTLHFVPPMLQVFLAEQGLEACGCLKRVICSGDALPFELQKRFFARLKTELHNLYGPTEAAIEVTFWACKHQTTQRIVPIGRPIANTQIYLLDTQLQPIPIGVPGELHIGGAPLARGYLNRPELTTEKFIANPFSQQPGERLYKTGDLARYCLDGNIEFLGRIDHQVKIRGFRIELGEIEAVLSQHRAVREAVVLAQEEETGNKYLVAYVVPKQESALSISELRSLLREKLPEYMLPSAFVKLDTLPLLPNGKVDRKALPAPERYRPELETAYQAPQTETERLIATVWQEKLQVEKVGIYDNFFDLGGHSLLVIQIHSKLREIFEQELSIVHLFKYPTINSLAKYLSQKQTKKPAERSSQERALNRSSSQALINQQSQLRQQHRSPKK